MLLKNVATVHSGIVLSRKKTQENGPDVKKYKILTLRSIHEEKGILEEKLEANFFSEVLQDYLTRKGDVVVRLSSPNTAAYIHGGLEGVIIPSQFCVIRVYKKVFLPEYLAWYLGSTFARKQIKKEISGSTVSIIRKGTLESLNVEKISIKNQKNILKINELKRREISLLKKLGKEKETLYRGLIHRIINDGR